MGRLKHDPYIHHFNHPLSTTINFQPHQATAEPCYACKLASSGWMYSCKPCNFTLHISCTQLPSLITHPIHPLALLPSLAYPGGAFNCDGCGHHSQGGFSYHCSHCGFDNHTTCASNLLSLTHQSHPHILQLTFHLPCHTKGFSCDICHKIGSNHWLYRCGPCEFDAHLECTMGIVPVTPPLGQPHLQQQNSFPGANHQYHQYGNRVNNPPGNESFYMHGQSMGAMQTGYYQQPAGNNGTRNNALVDAMVQGFVDGVAQQVGQNFVQSILGDGNSSSKW